MTKSKVTMISYVQVFLFILENTRFQHWIICNILTPSISPNHLLRGVK